MRHAILGVGGVGGLIGAGLAHAGEDVTLVLRPETLAGYPSELTLDSPFGKFSVPVKKTTSVADPYDVLWIATKATQLESALQSVENFESLGAIVPLLNGVDHVGLLRARFGERRVIPAAIRVESERVAPGRIEHRSPFVRLSLAATGKALLESVTQKLVAFGFTCEFEENEATLLWSKLVFLAPFALVATAGDLTKGEIESHAQWRSQFETAVHESCAVGNASGAKVSAEPVMKFFAGLPARMRSSMQKDVAAGNEPELDAIAGPILRGGEQHRIKVDVTRELVEQVKKRAVRQT